MWPWFWISLGIAGGVLLALVILYVLRRVSRVRHYSHLRVERADTIRGHEPRLASRTDGDKLPGEFQKNFIARAETFLDEESLAALLEEARANVPHMSRSYIPKHKKGATLSYEQIHHTAPGCLAFYHSPEVQRFISRVVGEDVGPTADHDQSSLSVLCYNQEGDHINWHFDHNFYKGRHFTVLLSLINRSENGGVSASKLERRTRQGEVHAVDTSDNVLVVFEGAKVLHRASPINAGDERMMLSMTYATSPRIGWFKDTIRRFKDTAYFGLRVLWD